MVGTFDVENFGDLLFPLLAREELGDRLGRPELALYSYHERDDGSWPYDVRSLVRLPDEIEALELLIVGGGHLVRFDKEVAPGYDPPSPRIHHPTGYWLAPTLLAACYGVPVAWNAMSTSLGTPDWAQGLLRQALEETAYLSVRDQPSLEELVRIGPNASVELVPDTAFGVAHLLPDNPSTAFREFCASTALATPYVIVQPSPHLAGDAHRIDDVLRLAQARGYAVLELPISPCLGDEPGLLGLTTHTRQPPSWPEPLLLSEVVANAEAVIARSLHLSIVALACGVPVHRQASAPDPKYRALHGFRGVVWWEDGEELSDIVQRGVGRRPAGPEIDEQVARLKTHWDAIASLPKRPPRPRARVASDLIARCTSELERLGTGHGIDGNARDATTIAVASERPAFSRRVRARLAGHRHRTPGTPSP